MKIRFQLIIIAALAISTSSWSQDKLEFDESVLRLQRLFDSDSSQFHFSLKEIDNQLITKIKALSDTLPYYPYTTSEVPYKRDKTLKSKITVSKPTNDIFLADNKDDWRSGDHVAKGTEHLPTRKFLFGITNKEWTAIFYWHGGVGKHLHIVLTNNNQTTAFVTLSKGDTIGKLNYGGQLDQITSYHLTDIVNIKDACYLNNKLMSDMGDIF